jgi:hypothetical protein
MARVNQVSLGSPAHAAVRFATVSAGFSCLTGSTHTCLTSTVRRSRPSDNCTVQVLTPWLTPDVVFLPSLTQGLEAEDLIIQFAHLAAPLPSLNALGALVNESEDVSGTFFMDLCYQCCLPDL